MGSGLIPEYQSKHDFGSIKHQGRISNKSISSVADDVDEMVSEKPMDQDEEPQLESEE